MNNFDKDNRPYDPEEQRQVTAEKEKFLGMLSETSLPPEMIDEVKNQLADVENDDNNIVFIFTEGEYVVTGIHVPPEAIDYQNGPVLMRGSNDNSIIAAFSRKFISQALDTADSYSMETKDAGLLSQNEEVWLNQLEKMASMVRVEMENNPPEKWDDFFSGEGR